MSTITDVKQIPGFNQQQYDALLEQAKSQSVSTGLVTASLLEAVNNGKGFDEALQMVSSDLPKLAPPNAALMTSLAGWTAVPAPGALLMAMITEISAEQRRENRELAWAQTEAVVTSMKDQAEEMRDMARTQLIMGLVSAGVTIAGGLTQSIVASRSGDAMLQSTIAQGFGTAISGGAKGVDAGTQFVGSMAQAQFKEMEADQEKMRAMRDSLKDLNDGLRELIQKSLASAENIQQGKNQATTRILA